MPQPISLEKKVLLISGVVVVAFLVWFQFLRSSENSSEISEANPPNASENTSVATSEIVFPVQVRSLHRGDLIKRLQTQGILRARREAEIVARVGGELTAVRGTNGAYVSQGELLAKLDDREYRIAFQRAASVLLAAQIEYRTMSEAGEVGGMDTVWVRKERERAQKNLEMVERDYQIGTIKEAEHERKRREYETLLAYYSADRGDVIAMKSGLAQAREQYERAKLNLEWTELKAPFSGYIADCAINAGMQVQVGKVLMKIVDVSSLLVDVEVLESEIGRIRLGARTEVSVNAYPNQKFIGKVAAINPIVDPKSKTVRVTIELRDAYTRHVSHSAIRNLLSAFLRPGMFASVKLEAEIFKERLLVPKEALLVRDQRTLVFVARDGLAKWHYVEVGEENEEFIEIRSGIAAGDTVIVNGHYTLAHDAKVKIDMVRAGK